MKISQAFSLSGKGVISIIGAGGKTTLMYSLAAELASAGKKVLTTTTTKIFKPTHQESPAIVVSNIFEEIIEKSRTLMRDCAHITAAAEYEPLHGKLVGLHPDILKNILNSDLFDYIIIEADGAARRSLKACNFNEPVVPEFTDYIVSMAGLDAVGKPLEEQWVFRSKIFSNITNLPLSNKITESSIAAVLIHDVKSINSAKSDIQRIVFLNKADNAELIKAGSKIAALLEKRGRGLFHKVIVGELKDVPIIHRCIIFD